MNAELSRIDPWTRASALLVGIFAAFVCYDQYFYWSTLENYSFGFIVPLFVAYVLYERWPQIEGYLLGKSEVAKPTSPGLNTAADIVFGLGLLLSLLVFMLGGALRISQGPANMSSLFIATGFAGIFIGMAFLNSRQDAKGQNPSLHARLVFTFLFLFPALAWLISAPMVMILDSDVKLLLMHWVSIIVFNTFDVLGLSIVREGNTLILPMGVVGVADACSGVRSLTGCIFAGSFLAAVFLNRFWKKVLMITVAIILAFFTNILRSLFLTGWAYARGSEAIDERVFTFIAGGMTLHDLTGYAVLGVTCVLLIMLLPIFTFTIAPPGEDDGDEEHIALAKPKTES